MGANGEGKQTGGLTAVSAQASVANAATEFNRESEENPSE
jgi:hypothetical protein